MQAAVPAMASRAPWREVLQRALKKNSGCRHSKYVQLATVRPDGRPANRTIVYRGFLGESDVLTFVTDARSRKIDEIAHNPWAEVAWYLPDTREQFRLLGKVTVVDSATEDEKLQKGRRAAWKNMTDPGRQQFMWPSPGEQRGSDDTIFKPEPPTAQDPVVDTFCLVCLAVEEVDHLQLGKNVRHTYIKSTAAAGIAGQTSAAGEEAGEQLAAAGAAAGAAEGAAAEGSGWEVTNVNP